jgi:hypothetical protein
VQRQCLRCGAELTADATECPTCAYGEAEDLVLLQAQMPGAPQPLPASPPSIARILATLAILVVVIVAIIAVLA